MNVRLTASGPASERDRVRFGKTIVGRVREIGQLDALLAEVVEGSGRSALVGGEAGIGKTRLAEEVARLAVARGFHVAWGACWEGGGAPAFWPWVQVIRTCAGRVLETEQRRFASAAPALAREVWAPHDLAPAAEGPAVDSEQVRFRLFDATAGLLKSAAHAVPLLVVLDDIHAADQPSLRLLQFLARDLRGARIALLATYREAEVGQSPALTEVVSELGRDSRRLRLGGLDMAEVAQVIASVAASEPAGALVEAVHDATGGNPFFIEEITQILITERRFDRPAADALLNLRLPEEVREAVRQHVRPLSRETVRLLSIAAVLGREFDRETLERLSSLLARGSRNRHGCREGLRPAIAAGVVAEVRLSRYRFVHALIRETLYEDLLPDEQVALHRAAATTLEGLHARSPEHYLPEIAHHAYRAATAAELDWAIEHQMRAGEQALRQCAHEQATELFERGLELCDAQESPDGSRRCEVMLALGEAQMRGVATVRAKATFERAAAEARDRGNADQLTRAALGIADAGIGLPGLACDQAMVGLLREALAALPDADSVLRARVLSRLAVELYNHPGSFAERRRLVDAALAMARRLDNPLSVSQVLTDAHYALCRVDNLVERTAFATETVRLADTAGGIELAMRGYWWLILDLIEAGDGPRLDRAIAEAERRAGALRQPRYQWITTHFRAVRALSHGEIAAAEALSMQAFEYAERASEPAAGQLLANFLFAVRVMQGRLSEFEPAMRAHLAQYPDRPNLHAGMAWMYAELGRGDEARAELESVAVRGFACLPDDYSRVIALAYLAETCAAVGDAQRGAELYELLLPVRDHGVALGHPNTFIDPPVAYFLGLLATILERWETAEEHFDASLEMSERMGMRPHVARTQFAYARMLSVRRRPGDRARAAALLGRAFAAARDIGMAALEQRVAALHDELRADAAPTGTPSQRA